MTPRTRNILLIDTMLSNQMLIREILLQLDHSFFIRRISNEKMFDRFCLQTTPRIIPDLIIVGYHYADQYAEKAVRMIRIDPAFKHSLIYIVGRNVYGSHPKGYWREIGADGYIEWTEKPSELKTALLNIIQPGQTQPE